ncbi:hypothetical protein JW916_12165 [Candidatus Sumerlaeota bacterium]|nr:hypothetical protein [Candidatus Sumerlaeota bacterium]
MKSSKENTKTLDDETIETTGEKKPYRAPDLARLGSVKQITEGIPDISSALGAVSP